MSIGPTAGGGLQTTFVLTIVSVICFVAVAGATTSPHLEYGSYFGTLDGQGVYATTVDASGKIYLAGRWQALAPPNDDEAFVARIDPATGTVDYYTALSGTGYDYPTVVTLDMSNNIWVAGWTTSFDFPVTANAYQPSKPGGPGLMSGFVAKLDTNGTKVYASYFGGSGNDTPYGIAVLPDSRIVIVGNDESSSFPLTPNALMGHPPSFNGFLLVLAQDGTPTLSSLIGGNHEDGCGGVAVDPAGFIYIAGASNSTNLPTTPGVFQTAYPVGASQAGFIAKIAPDTLPNATFLWLSYYGAQDSWMGLPGIGVDQDGLVHIAANYDPDSGISYLPTTDGSFWHGSDDIVYAVLNGDASEQSFCTLMGGSESDNVLTMALDPNGRAYLGGGANSTDFPLVNPLHVNDPGLPVEAFLMEISSNNQIAWSTAIGGFGNVYSTALGPGGIYAAGCQYLDGMIVAGAHADPRLATHYQGNYDGFILNVGTGCLPISILPTTLPDAETGSYYSQTLTASGIAGTVSFELASGALPPGLSVSSAGLLSGTPSSPGNSQFEVRATDSEDGCSSVQQYSLLVTCSHVYVEPAALPDIEVQTPFSATVSLAGGTPPYSCQIISGSLPIGLTLDPAGEISGTPTQAGQASFTLQITDAAGCVAENTYSMTVFECDFCDEFDDETLSSVWQVIKPEWDETSNPGLLSGQPTGKKAFIVETAANGLCGSNCTVDATMTAGVAGEMKRVWLLGWYTDKRNTVELLMKEENDKWILRQRSNGVKVASTKVNSPIAAGTEYAVKISFDGSVFRLYINNILSAEMPKGPGTSPYGDFGFATKNTTGQFDWIRIH